MLRIRMVEEAIAAEYAKQEMRCPTHLCIGQEAVSVGVCSALNKEDAVFSMHRSHGHYLARGGSLPAMIAELYGKATGCSGGIGGSMHLIDRSVNFLGATPIVAGSIPVAVGVALARLMQNKPGVAVAFFGDAALEEGTAHESMNYASLKKLPVLFVCENNLYSTLTPLALRQPRRPIFQVAKGHETASFQDDGNDVLAVWRVAQKALKFIRSGKGPVFLELLTYRYLEHCGPNPDPDSFRSIKEVAAWRKKDPVETFKRYCLQKKIVRKDEIQTMKNDISKEIEKAFIFAKSSQFLNLKRLEDFVYA